MKIISEPVEMAARFSIYGDPRPARYIYDGKAIDVEQIVSVSEEKLAGNRMKIFICRSEIEGKLKKIRGEV